LAPKSGSNTGLSAEGGEHEAPSAEVVRPHRDSLTNVLVVGGTAERREQVARAFHMESPLRSGAFVRVDCAREESRLRSALREWTGAAPASELNPLRAAERGTLFLDAVEHLSADSQGLLLAFARRLQSEAHGTEEPQGAGRLVTGNPTGLAPAVSEGRFLAALLDALDKVRVQLEDVTPGGSA
jgi:DNA-binding NtrC family response regulator